MAASPLPAPGEPVGSPCTNVCRIDPATGWCLGCRRSLDEIAAWSTLDGPARRAVWSRLAGRRIPALDERCGSSDRSPPEGCS